MITYTKHRDEKKRKTTSFTPLFARDSITSTARAGPAFYRVRKKTWVLTNQSANFLRSGLFSKVNYHIDFDVVWDLFLKFGLKQLSDAILSYFWPRTKVKKNWLKKVVY